eukprot:1040209_1
MARIQTLSIAILLCTCLATTPNEIQCDSMTMSHLTTQISDDYWFNVSSSSATLNWTRLDIEFITQPSIPIDIYFPNTTLYQSCFKQCIIRQTSLSDAYIIRLNRLLRANQGINYTLSVDCREAFTIGTTVSIYTSDIASMETEFDYSVSFNQQLTFGNRGNILSFGVSVLIVLLFLILGLIIHRDSDRPELQFLARKSNATFYVCAAITLFVSLVMCSSAYLNQYWLGVVIALTMSSINFVSVIGMKYYGSLIRNFEIKKCTNDDKTKKCTLNRSGKGLTLARLARFVSLCLGIFYLVIYYVCLIIKGVSLLGTVLFITYIEMGVISVLSLASKTAQVQWCILFMLIGWLHDSSTEEIFFDLYWYSVFCIGIGICSILLFANKDYAEYLTNRFYSLFGAFLSIFDITTDLTVMVLWIKGGLYFWTVMQLSFIFLGTIYSAFYIDDYYFIADGYAHSVSNEMNKETADEEISSELQEETERTKRLFWGRMLTFFGLGRVYHGILGWDEARHKDMEISNRVLKVWEMIFESFPTIVLQTWISLYTNLDVNIVVSLFVGMSSLTYSFWSVLYGDHSSPTREAELVIAQRIHTNRKVVGTTINDKAVLEEQVQEAQSPAAPKKKSTYLAPTEDPATTPSEVSEVINTVHSRLVDSSATGERLWMNFICFYPIKLIGRVLCNKPNEEEEPNKEEDMFTTKDKLYYFAFYVWVMTDFGIRIFPILACARLRQQYYEFLAVMLGLTIFEFFSYYYMLFGEFKTPRSALHFFWTLYFTLSYCLLSSMHVVYLPNTVRFDKLIVEHNCRMIISAAFMVFAMILQLDEYGSVFGFFDRSIYLFWFAWVLNWGLTFAAKKGFKELESKIKIDYDSDSTKDNVEQTENVDNKELTE